MMRSLQRDLVTLVRRTAVPSVHARLAARAGVDLELAEAVALGRLADDGAMRLTDLAGVMGVVCSTASRHAANLERRGLCARSVDPADGRAVVVAATPQGHDVLTRLRAAHCAILAEQLAGWTRDDLATLTDLVGRLGHALAAVPEPAPEARA